MKDCSEFKGMFLLCVWCGSGDHRSHTCPNSPIVGRNDNMPSGNDWRQD